MNYWTVNPPTRWQAGTVGAARTPFYFDCADCGQEDAEIAGILSSDGTYLGTALLGGDHGPCSYRPAMFCQPCFDARMKEAP